MLQTVAKWCDIGFGAVVVANFLRQQSSVKLGRHVKFMNSCHMKHGPLVKFLPLDNFIWCIVILKLAGLVGYNSQLEA